MRALVTGAGGFIGHHLVSSLKARGHWVRGVDLREPPFAATDADEFRRLDLRLQASCDEACEGIDEVYTLAADGRHGVHLPDPAEQSSWRLFHGSFDFDFNGHDTEVI